MKLVEEKLNAAQLDDLDDMVKKCLRIISAKLEVKSKW